MEITNDMHVGVPIEEAWVLLTDIPAIAPCLPGAELTGQNGEDFEGRIKVKVGPITAEYKGTARITEMNEADRRVLLSAKGRDARGSGNASADITAEMFPDDGGTRVTIVTQLKISGKVAQFGRGVMADVSKKLLDQFAECIEHKLGSGEPELDANGPAAASSDPADTGPPEPIELLDVAGGAVAKRFAPVIIAAAVVALVLLARRCRGRAPTALQKT